MQSNYFKFLLISILSLFIGSLIFSNAVYSQTFSASSMPMNEVVRNISTLYNDNIIFQSQRKELIDFEVLDEETQEDVYLKLAMLLVEYGVEYVEEGNARYFKDFDSSIPQISRSVSPSYNSSTRITFKYKVKNSPSSRFVTAVKSIFQEGENVADTGLNNTIVITTYSQRKNDLLSLLDSLDKPHLDFDNKQETVIKLDHVSPQNASGLITSSFADKYKYSFSADGSLLHINISPLDLKKLKKNLQVFDKPKKQVLLDVIIAEMTTGRVTELGTQLAFTGAQNKGLISYPSLNNVLGSGISALSTGLVLSFVRDKFSFILENIQTDATTKILSTPSLMTKEGYKASLVVGQSVPFKTGSYTSTGDSSTPENPFTTIERHDVGIKLEFTPRILSDGTIDLVLNQELSSIAVSTAGASDLITNKRQLRTNVIVENNDIIVLGGLVESSRSASESTVPLLSKVPLLGKLFRQKNLNYSSTNLMIFIRPRILTADSNHNRKLVQKYLGIEETRRKIKISNNSKIQDLSSKQDDTKVFNHDSTDFEHDFF